MTTQIIERTSFDKKLISMISAQNFDWKATREGPSDKLYRVPEHQRFPSWPTYKKEHLVDSIMLNMPIHSVILSEHTDTNGLYYNIQDGQTRLSALQEFTQNKYTWDGKTYAELRSDEKEAFNNYQVRCEALRGADEATIANIFERLNSGKPLSDNDKYHNRKTTSPVVQYVSTLKEIPTFRGDFKRYIGSVGEGKSRQNLSDIVGAILSLIRDDESRTDCINVSYSRNCSFINEQMDVEKEELVTNFFKFYFGLLDEALASVGKPQKCYGKLSGVLGLILFDWIKGNALEHRTIWRDHITRCLDKDYQRGFFNALSDGDARNLTTSSIGRRVTCVLDTHAQGNTHPQFQPVIVIDNDDEEDEECDLEK